MKPYQFYGILTLLGQLPARLTTKQAAWVLNCQARDMPALVSAWLLKPVGNPQPNSVKYFAAAEIAELTKDRAWLAKMTNAVSHHWKQKNQRKGDQPAARGRTIADTPLSSQRVIGVDSGSIFTLSS